jgi:hypothetical protein
MGGYKQLINECMWGDLFVNGLMSVCFMAHEWMDRCDD